MNGQITKISQFPDLDLSYNFEGIFIILVYTKFSWASLRAHHPIFPGPQPCLSMINPTEPPPYLKFKPSGVSELFHISSTTYPPFRSQYSSEAHVVKADQVKFHNIRYPGL